MDKEIQGILTELSSHGNGIPKLGRYSKESASQLLSCTFNDEILKKRLPYERLDLLTVDMLLGLRGGAERRLILLPEEGQTSLSSGKSG
jgi:hypothetical protein